MENRYQPNAMVQAKFMDYMNRRVPAVIYPAPVEQPDASNKIIVAPEESPTWWLGAFQNIEGAKDFCIRNGLAFTEHDACPEAVTPAKFDRQRMKG